MNWTFEFTAQYLQILIYWNYYKSHGQEKTFTGRGLLVKSLTEVCKFDYYFSIWFEHCEEFLNAKLILEDARGVINWNFDINISGEKYRRYIKVSLSPCCIAFTRHSSSPKHAFCIIWSKCSGQCMRRCEWLKSHNNWSMMT